MNKQLLYFALTSTLLFNISCSDESKNEESTEAKPQSTAKIDSQEVVNSNTNQKETLISFLPQNCVIFDTIYGDLNKDGTSDCVLITKNIDKTKFVEDEYRGTLDRNRRGIIILLNKHGKYEKFLTNQHCFSSENEDGGVYFPPDLYFEIVNSKLYINYAHGRYGYWKYTFRLKDKDFDLIGYDRSENHGPIVSQFVSINFLTKKKQVKNNINIYTENPENEVFEEIWSEIKLKKLHHLSSIEDFDELHFYED